MIGYNFHNADEIERFNQYDMPYSGAIEAAAQMAREIPDYNYLDAIPTAVADMKANWKDKDARYRDAEAILDTAATMNNFFNNAEIDLYACFDGTIDGGRCLERISQSSHKAIAWDTSPYLQLMRKFDKFLYDLEDATMQADNEIMTMQHNAEHRRNGQDECYGCDEYTDSAYGYGGYDYGMTGYGNGNGMGNPAGGAEKKIENLCNDFIKLVIDYEIKTAEYICDAVMCCNAILNGQVTGDEPDPYADWKAAGWEEFFD